MRKGAEVNVLGASQGIGALHWAAHKEHEEIAAFLIENGGDITLRDKEGRTPLSMASPELTAKMIGIDGLHVSGLHLGWGSIHPPPWGFQPFKMNTAHYMHAPPPPSPLGDLPK